MHRKEKKKSSSRQDSLFLDGVNFYLRKIEDILLGWLFLITLLMGRWKLMIAEVIIYFVICLVAALVRGQQDEV